LKGLKVKSLLAEGADVNAETDDGTSPLDTTNKPDMEKLLVEYGAKA
jgi:hypothetical protein